ncbi:MAG: TRAP transporter small permease [Alphaproteobacteria bacterium]|jgi:TRAP-type C4-dicarboxylate transport system permease small subunit
MQSVARAVLPRILSVLETFSAILLFVMMALTFVDVIGRYVFTAPIFGAAEMVQFLLAMTIFGGLSLINASDSHITVELFEPWFKRRIPRLQPILVQSFSVIVMSIIAWQLTVFAIEAHEIGSFTVVLEWPLVAVVGTVAGLSIISLIAQILGLFLLDDPETGSDHGDPL